MSTYISLHAIHTYPYANLNRDDLGSPKSLLMGGTNRIRISSQCLKRSIRRWAEDEGAMTASTRTREITSLIRSRLDSDELLPVDDRDPAATLVGWTVEQLSGSGDAVLAFFGASEIDRLVNLAGKVGGLLPFPEKGKERTKALEAAAKQHDLKSEVESILSNAESGVAAFGRFFADSRKVSVDGAVQMAHAFTVHEQQAELDYFTAVEDWVSSDEHRGAGHLNTAEFSSGTFYKYANIGLDELIENLNGDTDAATDLVRAFVRGFVLADPSGKQTSTAARTVPDLVYVAVEPDRPISLASAFECAIVSRDGYRHKAIARLNAEAAKVGEFLGHPAIAAHTTLVDDVETAALGDRVAALDDLVAVAVGAVDR